ncbi:MAG: 50S ribosomal protein L6 [Rhodospirillales bacterium]|jgi:large subunit ribosomal protein L6|nr:50S ribosomal protein L6 [Rhodospirillales bacterium]
MSRVGKHAVTVPQGVNVAISGNILSAKGKLGELSVRLTDDVEIKQEGDLVWVKPRNETLVARKMWGTARNVIHNVVSGVSEGFTRRLEINGVGYRAQVQGQELVLQLGFSHDIRYPIPAGIDIQCPDQTHINIHGANKQQVGQIAAEIRAFRPPEPYKGKGVKYAEETILRKEGKKK